MYYEDIKKKGYSNLKARKQVVRYLEIRSNKNLGQKVEKGHFEKGLGIAKITREGILNFCKKYHPEKYSDFMTEMESHPQDVFLDFENHFTKIENLPVYRILLKIAHQQRMQEGEDYAWLTQFLLIHPLRSHVFINRASRIARKSGDDKFVLFYFLKWSLADPNFLLPQSLGIMNSEWNFYILKKKQFPLSDQPVLIRKNFILATLSPTMILFIKRNRNKMDINNGTFNISTKYWNTISPSKYFLYKLFTILGTHKGLIFSDDKTLLTWKKSLIWILRQKMIRLF